MIKSVFKKRRILVITDEDITNLPLSSKSQMVIVIGVVVFISWLSFSSGKYFTFKHVIEQKESEVQQANLINLDLQTKIDSLQSNLVRLNEYFNTVRELDYNKEAPIKKKHNKELSSYKLPQPISEVSNKILKNYNFSKRLSFRKKHKVIDDINSNTLDRINHIKNIVAMTGLSALDMKNNNSFENNEIIAQDLGYINQGGPSTENISKSHYVTEETPTKVKGLINNKISSDINQAHQKNNIYFSENIEKLMYLEHLFNAIPFIPPMKRYYISSRYGFRVDPMTKRKANHYGIDFAGPVKAKVYSTAPGIVKFAGRKGNYGKFIEIDHGFNIVTRYGHLSKLNVKKGDKVERRQLIGFQGSTGRSSGPHVHYEIRFNDKNYNPQKFLTAGRHVF